MYRFICFCLLTFVLNIADCECFPWSGSTLKYNSGNGEQDSLKALQILYSGKVWKNDFRRFNGDQFLFANYFLPGSLSSNGKTYERILIRYDIYSDEIMIPVNNEEIVQVNKEIVDSFSIVFENKLYRFVKIGRDSFDSDKKTDGYFCVLYNEKSVLYNKYRKSISTEIKETSDGEFVMTNRVYLVKNKVFIPIMKKKDLINTFGKYQVEVKKYIKDKKLKVSRFKPESFIPLLRFYDSLPQ